MAVDCVEPDLLQIVDGCTQPDHLGDGWCTCLELIWQLRVVGVVKEDRSDLAATALIRRHRFQELAAAIEDPDPGWPQHLMAGKGVKVTAGLPDINADVRHALGTVDEHGRPRSL